MNIEVVARVRPPGRGEIASIGISGTRIESSKGKGNIFNAVYKPHIPTYDLYKESFHPLIEYFISGYNVCVLAFGETGSGKSYTLTGEKRAKAAILPFLINELFMKLKEERLKDHKVQANHGMEEKITVQCFQLYNEKVSDLLGQTYEEKHLEVLEDPFNGVVVKNITTKQVTDAAECTSLFRRALESRTHMQTDYGLSDPRSALFFCLDLLKINKDIPESFSRLMVVELPGAEKLSEDPTQLRMREGPTLNRSILAFRQLVSSLAGSPSPTRVINYSDSKLTLLLKDALGGNCKTKVLVSLKATETPSLSTILTVSGQLGQIHNFPIINDHITQELICQYRATILNLQDDLKHGGRSPGDASGSKIQEIKDQLTKVTNENAKLQEGREQLYRRIIELEAKYTEATNSWKQLSSKLELSDEEKLQIYKNLVDLQLENNKIIEESAADKYELTNKILSLENHVSEMETVAERDRRAAQQGNEDLSNLRKEYKELSDEYLVLKANHLQLTSDYQNEVAKNEELGLELVHLSNVKEKLLKDKEVVEIETMQEYYGQLRKLASKFTPTSLQDKDDMSKSLVSLRSENLQLEKQLLMSNHAKEGMVDVLRNEHKKELQKLEDKINELKMTLKHVQASQRESQRKLAGQSAELITTQADKRLLEEENNKLDEQLKEVSIEYSNRLQQYIHDISVYCGKMTGQQLSLESLHAYIDTMVRKVRDAQEHQVVVLEERVKTLKKTVTDMTKKHGKLLSAYSVLRFNVEAAKGHVEENENVYVPTEEELDKAQSNEIRKLTAKLHSYENEIKELKKQISSVSNKKEKFQQNDLWMTLDGIEGSKEIAISGLSDVNWNNLRKMLREFTLNTQEELETERASLLTRCVVAEEQVTTLQEYIDVQLKKYFKEMTDLKRRVGKNDRTNSADASFSYPR
ncbi:coiled-coil domain-containing protein 78-like [Actinia tenebrosa]|uniref:Coiled-coil domain-containing protein 78-like n=1 Tax=Actinia tenebrosa TaxID=6105 RepID=A0A6P8HMQ9_ACTTE|nr:coiled-coil domain-containing protein 78-like [Actinia tenebrosa]